MISAPSAAASGMHDAMVRGGFAAHNIANVNTAGFSPLQVTSVEMREGGVAPVVTAGGCPASARPCRRAGPAPIWRPRRST